MAPESKNSISTSSVEEKYQIVLRPLGSDPLKRPGDQRLRTLLKIALRRLHLRAESVRPLSDADEAGGGR